MSDNAPGVMCGVCGTDRHFTPECYWNLIPGPGPTAPRCECGSAACGLPTHSHWCPCA